MCVFRWAPQRNLPRCKILGVAVPALLLAPLEGAFSELLSSLRSVFLQSLFLKFFFLRGENWNQE